MTHDTVNVGHTGILKAFEVDAPGHSMNTFFIRAFSEGAYGTIFLHLRPETAKGLLEALAVAYRQYTTRQAVAAATPEVNEVSA